MIWRVCSGMKKFIKYILFISIISGGILIAFCFYIFYSSYKMPSKPSKPPPYLTNKQISVIQTVLGFKLPDKVPSGKAVLVKIKLIATGIPESINQYLIDSAGRVAYLFGYSSERTDQPIRSGHRLSHSV